MDYFWLHWQFTGNFKKIINTFSGTLIIIETFEKNLSLYINWDYFPNITESALYIHSQLCEHFNSPLKDLKNYNGHRLMLINWINKLTEIGSQRSDEYFSCSVLWLLSYAGCSTDCGFTGGRYFYITIGYGQCSRYFKFKL